MRRRSTARRTTIRIDIDRVVLEGLSTTAHDRDQIREAIEIELTRLVRERGLADAARSGGTTSYAQAPALDSRDQPPRRTGEAIARSVYASLGRRQ